MNFVTRIGLAWRRLVAAGLLILASTAPLSAGFEFTIEESEFVLPSPVVAIFPGGPQSFLTLSEDGVMSLRQLSNGFVIDDLKLDGLPIATSHAITPRGIREMALILSPFGGGDPFLMHVSATDEQLWPGLYDGTRQSELPVIKLGEFANPGVRHVFETTRAGITPGGLVIWDRADVPETATFVTFRGAEPAFEKAAFYPSELLNIGIGATMMAFHGFAGESSFFHVGRGSVSGNIFDEALIAERAGGAGTSFLGYVPSADTGGTGEVVLANTEARSLSIFQAAVTTRGPRHSRPLTVGLPRELARLGRQEELMLVGDQQLERIYVGVRGPDAPPLIWGYSRLKGGLEPLEPTPLPFALRDLIWVDSENSPNRGYFMLLADDGRTVTILFDIETAFQDQSALVEPIFEAIVEDVPFDVTTDNDALILQRSLAQLGYNVGVLDGIIGRQTESAIRAFQLDNGLIATGEVDERTAMTLESKVNSVGLGRWHAMIATHTFDPRGCALAKEDVPEVAALLGGRVPTGTEVYLVGTNDPFYVVAIGTGDDKDLAERLTAVIRSVAPRTDDGKTGIDSYVAANRDWWIDENCTARAVVQ